MKTNNINPRELELLRDEELVLVAQKGNELAIEILMARYKNLVRSKARTYFLAGADSEDMVQEGMIGLYKAIRDFDLEKQVTFKSFADMCIKRQVITAVKTATRQKHIPLNSYVSLSKPVFEDDTDKSLADVLIKVDANPENIFISKENFEVVQTKVGEILSDFERTVLKMYLSGERYQEIAGSLNRSPKSIDNALQRVKTKLAKCADF